MSTNAPAWLRYYPPKLKSTLKVTNERIWDAVLASAKIFPKRPAISMADKTLSYLELVKAVDCFVAEIESRGVPTDRILLLGCNSICFAVVFLAAIRLGAVSAPSLSLSREEILAQWEDFDPTIVYWAVNNFDEVDTDLHPENENRIYSCFYNDGKETISALRPVDGDKAPATPRDLRDTLAVVQYTSGTTGRAKGAMMTHRNLLTNAQQNINWFSWTEQDVNIWLLPLCHTWGVCCGLLSTLIAGAHLVLNDQPRADAPIVCSLFREFGGTILYASATLLYRLLDDPYTINNPDSVKRAFADLRVVKAGAMLTQGNLKERWDSLLPHAPLQQGYGLTEASPETHNNPPRRFKAGTVGVPIQSTQCRIVDPSDPSHVLGVGEAGEIAINGPQVFAGYWQRPEATEAALIDGWLLTGDIGQMDDEGYLTIIDRKKDLLKFRGFSIAPANIERVLIEHQDVDEVLVVGKRDNVDGEIPTACIVGQDGLTLDDLRKFAGPRLARYELPRALIMLDGIPKNHVGKPLRRQVREMVNS